MTIISLIFPGTRVLGVYLGIFTTLFTVSIFLIDNSKEQKEEPERVELEKSDGLLKEEVDRLSTEAMNLKNKLEMKKRELTEHQEIVSKYK